MSDDNGVQLGHTACPSCGSQDNLAIYVKEKDDGSQYFDGFCWGAKCGKVFSFEDLVREGAAAEFIGGEEPVDIAKLKASKKEPITKEQWRELSDRTGYEDYRGISAKTMEFYGHRVQRDFKGDISCIYYPETNPDREELSGLNGYKSRVLPKKFGRRNIGVTGRANELSGQHRFRHKTGKYILITGGENDKAAAFQMLKEMRKDEDFDPIPVVSPTAGEGSAAKQIADNYDFLDQFDYIVLGLDNDEAGQLATEEACKVLPKDKVKIAKWSLKDPHKMLEEGKQRQFVRNFYDAKDLVADQVKTSKQADEEMEQELLMPRIPLPPFLHKLQHIMAGGIPLGYMVNWGAATGSGKTTYINEMVYFWIFNSPYKVGILSLELTAGQYQQSMLSRHIGKKLSLMAPQEAYDFVRTPEIMEQRRYLREDEFGRERYTLLDDREGTLENVKLQIDKLIKKHGCKMIIIDPLNDLFEGAELAEQTAFVKYLKGVIKSGVAIFNVVHITKGKTITDKDGKRQVRKLTEDDFAGVSNIAKSGGCNILSWRDKQAEDEMLRNITEIEVPKCRWSGRGGPAGNLYYDNETHTLYELDDWLRSQVQTQHDSLREENSPPDVDEAEQLFGG